MSPITPQNVLQHELIGLKANVIESTHPGYIGVKGKIVDETKNTIVILDGGRKKRVQKSVVVLRIKLPDGSAVEVDGKDIVGRPVDRVKKKARVKTIKRFRRNKEN